MIIQNRQHVLALIAIAAIALFAADRLVITPLAASWKERAARIQDLKQSVTQGAYLLDRREILRERWERMHAQTLPAQFSAAEDLVLKSFDRWAQESGAKIGSIRPQWKANEPDYTLLECRADASGNLGAIARFLYELEKDPLAIKVDRLEMTSTDNNGQQITLTLQVSALVLTPEEQP
jgi:Tfp pilus assembly protein PilO